MSTPSGGDWDERVAAFTKEIDAGFANVKSAYGPRLAEAEKIAQANGYRLDDLAADVATAGKMGLRPEGLSPHKAVLDAITTALGLQPITIQE